VTVIHATSAAGRAVGDRIRFDIRLDPHAAARVRALRRARRNAQVRAIRVRRILLTR